MISNYKRDLLKIAFPIMLSNLIAQIQMLIDKIFLGRLDVIYMSAVGNATAPMWTTMSLVFTIAIGSTILISQAIGAGDKEKTFEYAASTFKFNNVIAIILFLFWTFCSRPVFKIMGVADSVIDYSVSYAVLYAPIFLITGLGSSINVVLQTSGYTKPLVISGIIRAGLNIFLDWALIFGNCGFPEMGVRGAALATTIAEYIGGFVLLFILVRKKDLLTKPSFKQIIHAKFSPFFRGLKLGIPAAAEDFAWNLGNLLLIRILNAISATAAGVYTIVFGIEVIPVCVFAALGQATLTLAGRETGKGDLQQMRKIVITSFLWSMELATFFLVLFMAIPKPIMSMFTQDQTIIASAAIYLAIVSINLYPKSGNIIVGSGIRGYGNTTWMLGTQLFGTVFITAVASIFVFGFKIGITGVFLAVCADEFVRCIINTWKLFRITKKKEVSSEAV
jgi:putative MATE family efflux protein